MPPDCPSGGLILLSYRLGPERGIYGHLAALETNLNVLAGIMATFPWSPNLYRGGVLTPATFAASYWCALSWSLPDQEDLEAAVEDFEGYVHVIAVQPLPPPAPISPKNASWQAWERAFKQYQHDFAWPGTGWQRVTIAVPWERPIFSEHEYRSNMLALVAHYRADGACATSDYIVEPSEMIVSMSDGGDLLPVADIKGKKLKPQLSAWAVKYLTQQVIPIEQRETTAFCLAVEMARAGVSFESAVERVLCSPTYVGEKVIDTAIKTALEAGFDAVLKRSRKWTM